MKFSDGRTTVEASQWFKIGDHPDDNSIMRDYVGHSEMRDGEVVRRPTVSMPMGNDETPCPFCSKPLGAHGEIAVGPCVNHLVHPGDWIVKRGLNFYQPYSPQLFEMIYKPL